MAIGTISHTMIRYLPLVLTVLVFPAFALAQVDTSTVGSDALVGGAETLLEAIQTGNVWLIIGAVLALAALVLRYTPVFGALSQTKFDWLPYAVIMLSVGFGAGVAAGLAAGVLEGIVAGVMAGLGSGVLPKLVAEIRD